MTLFGSTAAMIAAGLQLVGATTVVVGPILVLAQPTMTDRGPSRYGVELARYVYRRAVPRSHPADSYPETTRLEAPTEGE